MLPIILLVGAGAALWHHRKRKPAGMLTPQHAAAHSQLMAQEYHPGRLAKAAAWFKSHGLHHQAKDLENKAGQVKQQVKVAGELAQRARMADQNAIGMIAAIREQANAGNPRAQLSARLIADYCAKNPAPGLGPLGETPMMPHGEDPPPQTNPDLPPGWVPATQG